MRSAFLCQFEPESMFSTQSLRLPRYHPGVTLKSCLNRDASAQNASAVREALCRLSGNAEHTEFVCRGLECFSPNCCSPKCQNMFNEIRKDRVLTLAPSEFCEGLSRCCARICKVHIRIESEDTTRCCFRLGLRVVFHIPCIWRVILRTYFMSAKTHKREECRQVNLTSSRDAVGLLHECLRN